MPDTIISEIRDDSEAMAILSAFGFSFRDWSFISKAGGALRVLRSDLLQELFLERIRNVRLRFLVGKLRAGFDAFYEGGGFLLTPLSQGFSRLFGVSQAPLVFYGRYNYELLRSPAMLAVVGARDANETALGITRSLCEKLVKQGAVIVSGGARGIDSAAHRGALDHGGATVVISGTACDFFGDRTSVIWSKFGRDSIAIIYPFGPFHPQGKFMFVERNRYVCASSDAVIIVQGKNGSGSLHTAGFAKGLGVPLFAIPGNVTDPLSYAPNHLISRGIAQALVDLTSLSGIIKSHAKKSAEVKDGQPAMGVAGVGSDERPPLLRLLAENENMATFDELLRITGKSFGDLQGELLQYELAGRLVKRGAQFVLTGE